MGILERGYVAGGAALGNLVGVDALENAREGRNQEGEQLSMGERALEGAIGGIGVAGTAVGGVGPAMKAGGKALGGLKKLGTAIRGNGGQVENAQKIAKQSNDG